MGDEQIRPRITRPAVLVMAYKRHDVTARTLKANLNNAGMDYGLFVGDHRGICRNTNIMLWRAMAEGYDAFCIMGNDITEPYGWLSERVKFANARPTCGGVSIGIGWMTPTPKQDTVIGNILWPLDVVKAVGAWDERLDPHGAVDLDYCERANKAGYQNWYLPNMMANHMDGHDGVEIYGYKKQDEINRTWPTYLERLADPNYYIPFEDMSKYFEA
jgi:hypothetical protein